LRRPDHSWSSRSCALIRFNKAAEHGDPKAQFNIAVMHEDGEGAERDPALALKWYTKSAESGYKRPCYELGRIYENAECGVEKVCWLWCVCASVSS
jgi:TPR repeat protein